MSRHTLATWAINALSVILVAVGIGALATYDPSEPAAPTVRPPKVAAPADSPEPAPPVKVAKEVEPAAKPAATRDARPWPGFPEPSHPAVLVIDPTIDPYWHVDEAAATWNRVTGCRLFRVTYEGKATPAPGGVYRVREQAGLTFDGRPVRGLFGVWNDTTGEYEILLNPYPGPVDSVTLHELGHAIGLGHYHGSGVMSDTEFGLTEPSQAEVAEARKLNPKRCAS